MFMMLGLFTNFYVHEYIKKSNEKKKQQTEKAERDLNNNLVNGKESNGKKSNQNRSNINTTYLLHPKSKTYYFNMKTYTICCFAFFDY